MQIQAFISVCDVKFLQLIHICFCGIVRWRKPASFQHSAVRTRHYWLCNWSRYCWCDADCWNPVCRLHISSVWSGWVLLLCILQMFDLWYYCVQSFLSMAALAGWGICRTLLHFCHLCGHFLNTLLELFDSWKHTRPKSPVAYQMFVRSVEWQHTL